MRTGSSQWTSSIPPRAAERPHRLEDRRVAEPEVEDHERLGRRDAGVDHRRELRDRVVHPAEDRRAQREVDRGVVGRDPPELVDAGEDRAMGRPGRASPRIVEREERRRPAERRGHGVLEEPVRFLDRRDPGVRVDVDAAREDEQPVGADDLAGAGDQPDRSASTASIAPARTATSARRDPPP